MPKDDKHFFKATFLIAICAFISRVLGLLRQSLIASFYGATESEGLADCYSAAFKLPDIIFNLVAFGAISIVLIPYFSGFIKKNDLDKLKHSCSTFLNFFFLFISFFIIIGYFFAPYFVRNFLVKGWTSEQNIILTIKMTRILFIQVLFMTLSGIFGSYLNAIEKFRAYAFALLSYNIGIIAGILFFAPHIGIQGVAWGAVAGGFLHLSIQAIGSIKNGFRYNFGLPRLNNEIKGLIFIAIPRIIAISGEQLVKFFIVNIASFLFVGSIFIFENVENFSMVPYGMIAVSISTTTFPIFSKLYAAKEYSILLKTLLEKLRTLMFFMLPITVIMIISRIEIIAILLGHGKYSAKDVMLTANALAFYMIGIPFFSITIVVAKFYYAQKKSIIPMIATLISVAITIISCYFFSKKFDVTGLSIGRSLGYIIQTILLVVFMILINKKEKIFSTFPFKPLLDIFKIIAICLFLMIIGFILQKNISFIDSLSLDFFINNPLLEKISSSIRLSTTDIVLKIKSLFKIVLLGIGFSLLYAVICNILKIPEIKAIFSKIKII
ncbi:MAG: murein biosynthesis integral membrane protein MurJ [Spirochaetes bacterium]|nr:murein biosynthesis integral membrane protein MurJ [Spirochaetota bacterium]